MDKSASSVFFILCWLQVDARQLARTRHFQLGRWIGCLLSAWFRACEVWVQTPGGFLLSCSLWLKRKSMFGSEFAPYCFKNTTLSCVAVALCGVEHKIDCRHKTEMLATSSVSCSGHHSPLRHSDYYDVKLQPTDQASVCSQQGRRHTHSIHITHHPYGLAEIRSEQQWLDLSIRRTDT